MVLANKGGSGEVAKIERFHLFFSAGCIVEGFFDGLDSEGSKIAIGKGAKGRLADPDDSNWSHTLRISAALFLLFLVPQAAGERAPAKRAVVKPGVLWPVISKDEEIFGIDLGKKAPVRQGVESTDAHQVEIDELSQFVATGHWDTVS